MAITEVRPEAAPSGSPAIGYQRHPIWEWLTTTDHKKIGIMYLVNSYIFFAVAGLLAMFIRTELAEPGTQFFNEQQYNELFTMHGTTMIFLFVIPILAGFANYIVPLQIGALDMAFPRVNALSFWMLPLGGVILYSGYLVGGSACAGWTEYPPLSEQGCTGPASGGIGADLWIVALLLIGTSSILGAVNFITTIFNMRAPGMTMFRMPMFCWTVLVTQLLVLLATPVFATATVLLPFFSLMTFLIAVPTGVKFFNWISTMWKGKLTFNTRMLFAVGFLSMFLIGGIDGVFLASPPVDFALH